jgi:hypothetical protein
MFILTSLDNIGNMLESKRYVEKKEIYILFSHKIIKINKKISLKFNKFSR